MVSALLSGGAAELRLPGAPPRAPGSAARPGSGAFARELLLGFGLFSMARGGGLHPGADATTSACWPTPAWSTWASWPSASGSAAPRGFGALLPRREPLAGQGACSSSPPATSWPPTAPSRRARCAALLAGCCRSPAPCGWPGFFAITGSPPFGTFVSEFAILSGALRTAARPVAGAALPGAPGRHLRRHGRTCSTLVHGDPGGGPRRRGRSASRSSPPARRWRSRWRCWSLGLWVPRRPAPPLFDAAARLVGGVATSGRPISCACTAARRSLRPTCPSLPVEVFRRACTRGRRGRGARSSPASAAGGARRGPASSPCWPTTGAARPGRCSRRWRSRRPLPSLTAGAARRPHCSSGSWPSSAASCPQGHPWLKPVRFQPPRRERRTRGAPTRPCETSRPAYRLLPRRGRGGPRGGGRTGARRRHRARALPLPVPRRERASPRDRARLPAPRRRARLLRRPGTPSRYRWSRRWRATPPSATPLAYARAVEALAGVEVPPRARGAPGGGARARAARQPRRRPRRPGRRRRLPARRRRLRPAPGRVLNLRRRCAATASGGGWSARRRAPRPPRRRRRAELADRIDGACGEDRRGRARLLVRTASVRDRPTTPASCRATWRASSAWSARRPGPAGWRGTFAASTRSGSTAPCPSPWSPHGRGRCLGPRPVRR